MGGRGQLFVGLSTILTNSKILTFSFQYASKCTMYLQTKQVIYIFFLNYMYLIRFLEFTPRHLTSHSTSPPPFLFSSGSTGGLLG